MNNKHIPISTNSKTRLALSTQTHLIRVSPKVTRIKSSTKSNKSSEEIGGKGISTPKPRGRLPSSPFASPSKVSFSKLTPLRMTSTQRISSQNTRHSKNLTLAEVIPSSLSSMRMPGPQDLSFFITSLFDQFSSPEDITDYFFFNRGQTLNFEQFYLSCVSLNLDKIFLKLEKIFEEAKVEKCLNRKKFLMKALKVQNEQRRPFKKGDTFDDIFNKLVNKSEVEKSAKAKRIIEAVKVAKGSDDLITRLQVENSKVKLSGKEIHVLLDQRNSSRKKKDLNMTVRVNCSPYNLIPAAINKKNL